MDDHLEGRKKIRTTTSLPICLMDFMMFIVSSKASMSRSLLNMFFLGVSLIHTIVENKEHPFADLIKQKRQVQDIVHNVQHPISNADVIDALHCTWWYSPPSFSKIFQEVGREYSINQGMGQLSGAIFQCSEMY